MAHMIKTHKARSIKDIVEILEKTGTFTCPTLPHHRYDRTKSACIQLKKRGFIKISGRTDISNNYIVTDRFHEWKKQKESNLTELDPVKWQKENYPMDGKRKRDDQH